MDPFSMLSSAIASIIGGTIAVTDWDELLSPTDQENLAKQEKELQGLKLTLSNLLETLEEDGRHESHINQRIKLLYPRWLLELKEWLNTTAQRKVRRQAEVEVERRSSQHIEEKPNSHYQEIESQEEELNDLQAKIVELIAVLERRVDHLKTASVLSDLEVTTDSTEQKSTSGDLEAPDTAAMKQATEDSITRVQELEVRVAKLAADRKRVTKTYLCFYLMVFTFLLFLVSVGLGVYWSVTEGDDVWGGLKVCCFSFVSAGLLPAHVGYGHRHHCRCWVRREEKEEEAQAHKSRTLDGYGR